ncbi:MAG: hypothetical protein L3K17_07915 [Thermoplasmata archaeon]|nr:hypothetical protein [Thermoplasmata archaeon]
MATGAIKAPSPREMVEARYLRRSERPDLGAHNDAPAPLPTGAPAIVTLRPLKEVARRLAPAHPLRILLLGEPDEMPAAEFASKAGGWLRLLAVDQG